MSPARVYAPMAYTNLLPTYPSPFLIASIG